MRPPGYQRPLPFNSMDRLFAAAGVDLATWRGISVVVEAAEPLPPEQVPEGEQIAGRPRLTTMAGTIRIS